MTTTNAARIEAWNGTDLEQPLRWHTPRLVVLSGDLFKDGPGDDHTWALFNVMEQVERHTFYVLTSRYARMAAFTKRRMDARREYAAKFDHCPTEAMRNSPAAQWARNRAATPPTNIHVYAAVQYDDRSGDVLPVINGTSA